jgi:hypothetical protein
MTGEVLPAKFADLVPYVAEWSLEMERDRAVKRVSTDIEKLRRFHEAVSCIWRRSSST